MSCARPAGEPSHGLRHNPLNGPDPSDPMAIRKSELYSSLWASCDALRGGMDASQYKDYVLVLLFLKYISDKYAGQPYAPLVIPEGSSFADMVALKGSPDLGDQLKEIGFTSLDQSMAKLRWTVSLATPFI